MMENSGFLTGCYCLVGLVLIIVGFATETLVALIIGIICCVLMSIALKFGVSGSSQGMRSTYIQRGGYFNDITSSAISNL